MNEAFAAQYLAVEKELDSIAPARTSTAARSRWDIRLALPEHVWFLLCLHELHRGRGGVMDWRQRALAADRASR